jgi:ABC-type multidrug transport system ATPase subunit
MAAMKELAGAGRTIVAVIHQPRSSIFTMLDDLVLLSEGRTVYVGPAKDAHAWFAHQGFACPASAAPSDFFLDTVSKVREIVEVMHTHTGQPPIIRGMTHNLSIFAPPTQNRTTAPPPWRP